uniref:transmembrane channel-like protein 7 isoform X2 n=1 Tax=Myxine glutinosa TaxID=7769 RepID=UPI00358E80F0
MAVYTSRTASNDTLDTIGTDNVFTSTQENQNTLVLKQLPSWTWVRRRTNRRTPLRAVFASHSFEDEQLLPRTSAPLHDLKRPVCELPLSMREKKDIRRKRKEIRKQKQGCWKTWYHWCKSGLKRWVREMRLTLDRFQPWGSQLRQIQGKFGMGTRLYFAFLRFLVILNATIFLMLFVFISLPLILSHTLHFQVEPLSGNFTMIPECKNAKVKGANFPHYYSRVLDVLSGTGFLEPTYLFYGYYETGAVRLTKHFLYNIPIAYLLGTTGCLLLSLILIIVRSAESFKYSLVKDDHRFYSYSNKVFSGWDFRITSDSMAVMNHHLSMFRELRTDLEEDKRKEHIERRSRREWVKIYFLRALINVLVLLLLAGSFYCVYITTKFQSEMQNTPASSQRYFVLNLIIEYLPSIVITVANFFIPLIFAAIIVHEKYTPAFELNLNLTRSVFLRLASVAVLVISLWLRITRCDSPGCRPCGYNHVSYPCWEMRVGQEMYKLTIFDFIIVVCMALFVEWPRRLLGLNPKLKKISQQQFDIAQNVLDLVYSQTICWVGTFFCPFLPLITSIKFFIIFYMKLLNLFANYTPPLEFFRVSSWSFSFMLVLLCGLGLSVIPVTYSLGLIRPSQACGPFRGLPTMWAIVPATIQTMPYGVQRTLRFMLSETFAVPLVIMLCLVMFYVVALAKAHKRVVEQLQEQLATEARDKVYLVREMMRMQAKDGVRNIYGELEPFGREIE